MNTGEHMKIDNQMIYYEKYGDGNRYLLFLPGALGKLVY